jgi:hypothetical protein
MAPLFLELEMNLTQEMKDFVHLMARALAKVSGSENPIPFADTVLEHAVAEAAKPVEAVKTEVEAVVASVETPAAPAA